MPPDVAGRTVLVRRSTLLLIVAQACLWGALGTFAAQAPVAVDSVGGGAAAAGVLLTLYSLALGLSGRVAGRLMDRSGRRPVLVTGYVILAVGGAAAAAAVLGQSFGLLVVGIILIGTGTASGFLGRAAVADMYPPEQRGRAVGALVVAGTVGAVGGPPLSSLVHSVAEPLGESAALAAPWLLVPILSVVAFGCVLALRPDPTRLAIQPAVSGGERAAGVILRLPPATAAAATIGLSHATMTTFMTIVPLGVLQHGSTQATVSVIVSLHLGGMFAFSPLVGSMLDRWGRRPGQLAGLAVLVVGVGLCAFVEPTAVVTFGLFLIGLGWSAAYLGSTAVVSDLSAPAERGGALGLTDLISGLSAAAGVLAGAALVETTSIRVLGVVALVFLAVPVAMQARLRDRSRSETSPV